MFGRRGSIFDGDSILVLLVLVGLFWGMWKISQLAARLILTVALRGKPVTRAAVNAVAGILLLAGLTALPWIITNGGAPVRNASAAQSHHAAVHRDKTAHAIRGNTDR